MLHKGVYVFASLAFLLLSCSGEESSSLYHWEFHNAFLNETAEDPEGNSFKITAVKLDGYILSFTGDFVFNNLNSQAFFVSNDGHDGVTESSPFDYEYYLSLEATNARNSETLSDSFLTFSGERILSFQTDGFFVSQFDDLYYPNEEEKVLFAYFLINMEDANRTCFEIPLSQIERI